MNTGDLFVFVRVGRDMEMAKWDSSDWGKLGRRLCSQQEE